RVGAPHPGGAAAPVPRTHVRRDRPPPVDGPGGRPDPGHGARPAGGARDARRAPGPGRPLRAAVPAAVRARGPGRLSDLPPGPPFPAPLQTALWLGLPIRFLEWCDRRYGEVFTL